MGTATSSPSADGAMMNPVRIWILLVALAGCNREVAPPCSAVADHVNSLFGADDHAKEIRGVFATRCEQDQWPPAARACIKGTRSLDDPRNCKQKLTADQVTKLDADIAALEDRAARQVIPALCARYERALAQVLACDVLPQDARDSLRQAFETFKTTWPGIADKRTLAPVCGSAITAVKAAAAGCPGAAKW